MSVYVRHGKIWSRRKTVPVQSSRNVHSYWMTQPYFCKYFLYIEDNFMREYTRCVSPILYYDILQY